MAGSSIGKNFVVTTWGESHGKAIGAVVDGCPAGLKLCESDIQKDLDRRKPGQSEFSTPRQEDDTVEILSGVIDGFTTGTPISLIIQNKNQRSYDYSNISKIFRPGHADYTYQKKYGLRDVRGGGRSSGRETAARVAAGAIARKVLSELNIFINAYTVSIGDIAIDRERFDIAEAYRNALVMPDSEAYAKACIYVEKIKTDHDSAGGIVECVVSGLPSGIGEPVFEKLDANLAKAIMSIGAVKGVEIGSGFCAPTKKGSQNNDPFRVDDKGEITKKTNNSGGITGGISEGFPVVFRAAIKPTPSIKKPQETVTVDLENTVVEIEGRHDPLIVPRAVVVIEAMTALTLTDFLFQSMFSKLDTIKSVFRK